MKKLFLGLLFAGSFALVSAQTISFDKTTIDYGNVAVGADGQRVVTVTNKGNKPLIISKVSPSCGCTTPKWSNEPIMPGKSAKIEVGYNTQLKGGFKKSIDVYSNDPKQGRTVLWIEGKVS